MVEQSGIVKAMVPCRGISTDVKGVLTLLLIGIGLFPLRADDADGVSVEPTDAQKKVEIVAADTVGPPDDVPALCVLRNAPGTAGTSDAEYQRVLMKPDGTVKRLGLTDDGFNTITQHRFANKAMKDGEEGVSPSRRWRVVVTATELVDSSREMEQFSFVLHLRDGTGKMVWSGVLPFSGWGSRALGWHAVLDLFYYSWVGGASNCRASTLMQFDPVTWEAVTVGATDNGHVFSRDGDWIVFTEPGCRHEPSTLKVFNVVRREVCEFPNGGYQNHFEKWAGWWDRLR